MFDAVNDLNLEENVSAGGSAGVPRLRAKLSADAEV